MQQHYTNPMRRARTALLSAFLADFAPLRHQPPTSENKTAAADILARYIGQLQMIDLTLSQDDARDILKTAYRNHAGA